MAVLDWRGQVSVRSAVTRNTALPSEPNTSSDTIYQPARPLNRITLFEFKTLDDNLGESPMGETLERLDPLMHAYSTALNQLGKQALFQKSLEELLAEHPFDETTPPFQRIAP